MNANNSHAASLRRPTKTFQMASLTGAIRLGLSVSVALLALGGSGAAMAGNSCFAHVPSAAFCLDASQAMVAIAVADLTLVKSDAQPSSVTWSPDVGFDAMHSLGHAARTQSAAITYVGALDLHHDTTASADHAGLASSVYALTDVTVVNNTDIYASDTGSADVVAWNVYAPSGSLFVDNQSAGTVTAVAYDGNAIALLATAHNALTITNEGAITATSTNGYAAGIVAQANGDASLTSSGYITATSTNYQAIGVVLASAYGNASVTNSGSVTATGGQDQSVGIEAYGSMGASVSDSGAVSVTSLSGGAVGINAQAYDGIASISITTGGFVYANNTSLYDAAIGATVNSVNGRAAIDSSGIVLAINHDGLAVGLEAYAANGSGISNSNYVLAGSYHGSATGLSASATDGDASVSNTAAGNIRTVANGDSYAQATGISAISTYGDASVINDGHVQGKALYGTGTGILARAGGTAYVGNTGIVQGTNAVYGDARGIEAISTDGAATVVNSGEVRGYSLPILGPSFGANQTQVDGLLAISSAGRNGPTALATVVNSGLVNVQGPWFAKGINTFSYGGVAITNTQSGQIYAKGLNAYGIASISSVNTDEGYGFGATTIDNAGHIVVSQRGNCYCGGIAPVGVGIGALSSFGGDVAVTSSGSIGVNTENSGFGILVSAYAAAISVDNSGSMTLYGGGHSGVTGIYAVTTYADTYGIGGISIVNSGDITLTTAPLLTLSNLGGGGAAGIIAVSDGNFGPSGRYGGDDVTVLNAGNISVTSNGSQGIRATSGFGTAMVTNSGDITVNGESTGSGISVTAGTFFFPDAEGGAILNNTGNVSVTGAIQAIGLFGHTGTSSYTPANVDAFVAITNSGSVFVSSKMTADGVWVSSYRNNPLTFDNSGSIYARTDVFDLEINGYLCSSCDRGRSVGVQVTEFAGEATLTNSGDIKAVTHQDQLTDINFTPGSSFGIVAETAPGLQYGPASSSGLFGYANIDIVNTGSISGSLLSSNSGPAVAPPANSVEGGKPGPRNNASGIFISATYGDVVIANAGSVAGSAQSDHYAGGGLYNGVTTGNGIATTSTVGAYDYTAIYHTVYYPDGSYAVVYDGVASTLTLGDISLSNSAAGTITAYASSTDAVGTTALANGITATVVVGNYGGSLVSTDTGITIHNDGNVSATALIANDQTGVAIANGISAVNGSSGGFVDVANSGHVSATATGPAGTATGLVVSGAVVTASNAGSFSATFDGAGGKAYGAKITSGGDLGFTNSGGIFATAGGDAVGVQLNAATDATLANSGSITGTSSSGNSIAVQTGAGNDTITNSGTINGAVLTGAGNDTFANYVGGIWNVSGTSTDFGTGDDTITNAGTINLHDSAISLGTDPLGNVFSNSSLITALGSNVIDMGEGNPNPFVNTGSVDFRNGSPTDVLTLLGNWSGSGRAGFDVNSLLGTSDKLHIVGNVVPGSVTSVDVNLLALPTTALSSVAVIDVTGDSTASSFVLGDVHFDTDRSFLVAQGINLTSTIDASNAHPDVFSVGIAVTGLTDAGSLAASFAPGVQSLMESEVGTWRQRMGVMAPAIKGHVSAWARAFSDSGTVTPDHVASNFGQGGNLAFDQTNSGQELGVDIGIADGFSVGLLLGKAQGDQTLNGTAVSGRNKIKGDTRGLYGSWFGAGGLYIDASYRTMDFDARLETGVGISHASGKADAFNIELGREWTFGDGFAIVPQLQYTRTSVKDVDTLSGVLTGFTPKGGTSSRGRLGLLASKTITSGRTTWTPYASVNAVREFDGDNGYTINNTFSGSSSTKGTSALVEGGIAMTTGKLSLFGGLNWQDGGALQSFVGGQIGLRYNW